MLHSPRNVLLASTLAALLIAGCGADSASDSRDESNVAATTAAEPTTATEESEGVDEVDEPPSGFVRLTFNVESSFTDPELPELATFEVFSTSDDTPILFGSLDETGTIDVPADALPERLLLQAEFIGDPFCWWTGVVGVFDLQTVQQLEVELEQECA